MVVLRVCEQKEAVESGVCVTANCVSLHLAKFGARAAHCMLSTELNRFLGWSTHCLVIVVGTFVMLSPISATLECVPFGE